MSAVPQGKVTVDEYLAWAEGRPGRYELFIGQVYQMAPQRAVHARLKFAVQRALLSAIQRAAVPCEVLPDGMTLRVNTYTAYGPDALVYCGPKVAALDLEIPNPVIVVEVLSPFTRHVDATAKLSGYFSRPSVEHYLVIDPDQRLVFHHTRGGGQTVVTRFAGEGVLSLNPPGIELSIEEVLAAAD